MSLDDSQNMAHMGNGDKRFYVQRRWQVMTFFVSTSLQEWPTMRQNPRQMPPCLCADDTAVVAVRRSTSLSETQMLEFGRSSQGDCLSVGGGAKVPSLSSLAFKNFDRRWGKVTEEKGVRVAVNCTAGTACHATTTGRHGGNCIGISDTRRGGILAENNILNEHA